MKLYDKGVFLIDGTEIVQDELLVPMKTGKVITKEQAKENTIAYDILKKT